jgi:hypothetical protein
MSNWEIPNRPPCRQDNRQSPPTLVAQHQHVFLEQSISACTIHSDSHLSLRFTSVIITHRSRPFPCDTPTSALRIQSLHVRATRMTDANGAPRRVSMAYILGFSDKPYKEVKSPAPPPLPQRRKPSHPANIVITPVERHNETCKLTKTRCLPQVASWSGPRVTDEKADSQAPASHDLLQPVLQRYPPKYRRQKHYQSRRVPPREQLR